MEMEHNFTIVDPQNMKTLAFLVNKEDDEGDVCTLQKLDCSTEQENGKFKKTFFVSNDTPINDGRDIILLTVGDGKALLNSAILKEDKLLVSKNPSAVAYKTLYSEKAAEYKDIKYTPNFKRPISIIDPEIGDEVKPVLYYDNEANMVKAKVKMQPNKSYIALEVRY